jgi:hypothetical protein
VKLIYVAGPFSAPTRDGVEQNIARAVARGLQVAQLGALPVIPHSNTSDPEFEDIQPYQFWIEATAELCRRCDALLTVHGWENSSGARGEVEIMRELGRPVFHKRVELRAWLEANR